MLLRTSRNAHQKKNSDARIQSMIESAASPLRVHRKNVVLRLRYRVARCPAFGVVPLRRLIRQGAGPEGIGRGLIFKLGIPPAAAVGESLAILHHEINVME